MASTGSQTNEAMIRLLFKYPSSFDTLVQFDQYAKDISLVTTVSTELIERARSEFLRKPPQSTRRRPVMNGTSVKYWMFDILVMVAIAFGLTSICGYDYNFTVNPPVHIEHIQSPASIKESQVVLERGGISEVADECECSACSSPPPLSKKMFKVFDTVDVFDPSLRHPFTIPWEIREIYSNKQDGSIRLDLQRVIAGRKSMMVLENVNAETVFHIEPFAPNDKAMCEFHLEIHPCTVLGMENPDIPGGGLYAVSFTKDGRVLQTYRPRRNIFRIQTHLSGDDYHPSVLHHPLAE